MTAPVVIESVMPAAATCAGTPPFAPDEDAFARLIRHAQQGNALAFQELVTLYRRRVLGTIARMIGRPDDAEDVAQEVFLRLYLSLDRLREPGCFAAWLYRLVLNAGYDYLRRKRRAPVTRMAELSEARVAAADAAQARSEAEERKRRERIRDQVQSLLSALSARDRMLLLLKEVEGLSIKELAAIYGVREEALKVRLFRARQRALRSLTKRDGSPS